jgi:hypothetical protein
MAASSPSRAYDSGDDEDPVGSEPAAPDSGSFEGHLTSPDTTMYGQFTWTVALPAAPADKDSLADISKIRQFRYSPEPAADPSHPAVLLLAPSAPAVTGAETDSLHPYLVLRRQLFQLGLQGPSLEREPRLTLSREQSGSSLGGAY